jgi:hypothetical protein
MHKISKFLMFVICAIVISFCTACLKGNFKLKKLTGSFWEPDVAIPLVNSSMTLNNILTLSNINNNFSIDADNFITLVYRGNLLSVRADEALKIPDQPIDSNFTFPSALTPGFDALPVQDTFLLPNALQGDFAFNAGPNGAYIDSMSLKTCLFALNLISGFQHQLLVNISIPGARKNGIPFSTEVIIPAAGGSPITRSANFSLAGYRINLNQNGVSNRLKINFGLKIIKTNTTIQPGQDNLGIVMSLSNISFKNLFGWKYCISKCYFRHQYFKCIWFAYRRRISTDRRIQPHFKYSCNSSVEPSFEQFITDKYSYSNWSNGNIFTKYWKRK